MERLTYWNCKEKGSALPVSINEDGDTVCLEDICGKLAAYEDAEAEGWLMVLPCKVGDTVYAIRPCDRDDWFEPGEYVGSDEVIFVGIGNDGVYVQTEDVRVMELVGRDVFLTRPEAEAALKTKERESG